MATMLNSSCSEFMRLMMVANSLSAPRAPALIIAQKFDQSPLSSTSDAAEMRSKNVRADSPMSRTFSPARCACGCASRRRCVRSSIAAAESSPLPTSPLPNDSDSSSMAIFRMLVRPVSVSAAEAA